MHSRLLRSLFRGRFGTWDQLLKDFFLYCLLRFCRLWLLLLRKCRCCSGNDLLQDLFLECLFFLICLLGGFLLFSRRYLYVGDAGLVESAAQVKAYVPEIIVPKA